MPFTTYTELKTAIGDWILHDDAIANVDDFIDLLEAELRMVLNGYNAEAWQTHTVPVGETHSCIPLPTDWNGARLIQRNCVPMDQRTPRQFAELRTENFCNTITSTWGGFFTVEAQRLCVLPAATEAASLSNRVELIQNLPPPL